MLTVSQIIAKYAQVVPENNLESSRICSAWEDRFKRSNYHDTLKRSFGQRDRYKNKLRTLARRRRGEHHIPPLQGLLDVNKLSMLNITDDEVLGFVEDLAFLSYDLVKASSLIQYAIVTARFLAKRLRQSVSTLFVTSLVKFADLLKSVNLSGVSDNILPLQVDIEDPLDFAMDSLQYWPSLKKSALWRKVRTVMTYVTSISLWDNKGEGVHQCISIEKEQYASKGMLALDMIHAILDLSIFTIDRGYQWYKTGNASTFLHTGGTYEKWYTGAQDIIANSKFISNPEPHGIKIHDFIRDINLAIVRGTEIFSLCANTDPSAKKLIAMTLSSLKTIKSDMLNKQFIKKDRRCPLALCVAGHSKVAKTNFVNVLHKFYCLTRGLKSDATTKYNRNPDEEHWNKFTSDVVTCVFDDMAYEHENMLKSGMSKASSEVIMTINNNGLVVNMAAIEEKGTVPFLCELVVATTNSPSLHADTTHACPIALRRRFASYIHIEPIHPYQSDANPTMIDSKKVPPGVSGHFDDLWRITIQKVVADGARSDHEIDKYRIKSHYETTHVFDGLRDFLPWYKQLIDEHNFYQDQYLSSIAGLDQMKLCNCGMPEQFCRCSVNLQGDVEEEDFDPPSLFVILITFIMNFILIQCAIQFGLFVSQFICLSIDYGIKETTSYFTTIPVRMMDFYTDHLIANGRVLMKRLGDKVLGNIPKFLTILMAALSAAVILYVAYKYIMTGENPESDIKLDDLSNYHALKTNPYIKEVDGQLYYQMGGNDLQGNVLQTITPVSKGEMESTWIKPDFTPTPFDFTPVSVSFKGMTKHQVDDVLLRNSVSFKWHTGTIKTTACAFAIGGQYWITDNHTVPKQIDFLELIVERPSTLCANQKMKVSQSDIYRFPDKDVAIIRLRNFENRKRYDLFCDRGATKYCGPAYYIGRDKRGEPIRRTVRACSLLPSPTEFVGLPELWVGRVDDPTFDGMCGSVLYAQTQKATVILGLHQRGENNVACALPITKEFIDDFFAKVDPIVVPGIPLLDTETTKNTITQDIHFRSVANKVQGQATVRGCFEGFRASPKSHVVPTLFCDSLVARGFPLKHGPPVMKGMEPWRLATAELVKSEGTMDDDILRACSEDLLTKWCSVGPIWKDELAIYSAETVINGVPGMRFIDKINRNTSAGFPWRCSKKFFMTYLPESDVCQNPIKFDEEIMDRVDLRIAAYLNGEQSHPFFVGALKDEAKEFKKITSKATRMFLVSSLDFTIVMRMTLLSFTRVVQMHPHVFEQSPGLAAQTIAWDHLYKFMTQYGLDHMIGGDYKGFDKSMQAHVMLWAFDVIIKFHERGGASEDHLKLIRGIAYDISFALADINGTIFSLFGKNPSGQALTVQLNGVVGSLYVRVIFVELDMILHCHIFADLSMYDASKKSILKFGFAVLLTTYGDDMWAAVRDDFDWFNHTAIAEQFTKHQIIFTMADKEMESVPFLNVNSIDFLKRKFRYESELNAMVCPLEESSIIKSLQIGVVGSLSAEMHAITVANSALQEFFFHGKEKFIFWRNIIEQMISNLELEEYLVDMPLPTWEELINQWIDNSSKYLLEMKRQQRYEETLPLQGSCYSCLCGFDDCMFDGDTSDARICNLCGYCRFNDWDLDCPVCRQNDSCEMCGIIDESVMPRLEIRVGYYHPFFCVACALSWRNSTESNPLNLNRCPTSPVIVNQVSNDYNEGSSARGMDVVASLEQGYSIDQIIDESEMDFSQMPLQGEEAIGSTARAGHETSVTTVQSQTAVFTDTNEGEKVEFASASSYIFDRDMQSSADLGDFLQRPVLIDSISWTESGLSHTQIDPWSLFLNTAQIKSKLNNFAWFRGNLRVKAVINTSPFYYGTVLMAYTPLSSLTLNPLATTGVNLIPWSQRPHIWIYPQTNSGGELNMPFLYPQNFIDITTASTVAKLGAIDFIEYVSLASANGATINGCTIQVYAWIEDPVLFGPTVKLALQGRVEETSSAIAVAATSLSTIPIIGPFATAASITAGAVSNLANLFGWCNPPVVTDIMPVKNEPFCDLSNSNLSDCATKFTLDKDAEISVDPGIIGLGSEDELSIPYLVQKESFLTEVVWNCNDAIGKFLFSSFITPAMSSVGTPTANGSYTIGYTPVGYLSKMFNNWRGDMIFRIKVISSKYHSGRLRITWDPVGNLSATTDYTHVAFTKIVDIQENDDVEIRIPYMQALPWLSLSGVSTTTNAWSTSSTGVPTIGSQNGCMTVRVLTNLSAPVDVAPVVLQVFVRGAENLEFANPTELEYGSTFYPLQGEVEDEQPMQASSEHPERYLINWGESITSLRTLLRRSNLVDHIPVYTISTTDNVTSFSLTQTRFPLCSGYDPNGIASAKGVEVVGTTFPFNFSRTCPLAYIAPMFVAQRGSIRWHYNIDSPSSAVINSFSVQRQRGVTSSNLAGGASIAIVPATPGTFSGQCSKFLTYGIRGGASGTSLTNCLTQTGVNIEMPFMTNAKFQLTNPYNNTLGITDDGSSTDTYFISTYLRPASVSSVAHAFFERFVCAGADYNLHFFLNAPIVYYNANLGATPV